ncbi:MAG: O-antigen ligase family protein [Rhizobiaceae bacterium]|nr:O-antigen ligase family protein [Rhizobiaceae bacterium]
MPLATRRKGIRVNLNVVLAFGALAVLVLTPLFRSYAALCFLLFGGALIALRPHQSMSAILRYWYILILPAFCLFSTLWSQFPANTLRYSIQLAITFAIAIVIARRISPTVLARCFFGIYGVGIVGSILFGHVRDDIGAWIGIFDSKNAFAAVISGFSIAALAVLLDRLAPKMMRLAALVGLAVSGPLIVLAQSTGAIATLMPALALALLVHFSGRFSRAQKLFLGTLIVLGGAALVMLLVANADALFGGLLSYFGKDTTLTGRTELWAFGWHMIHQNPLFGVGYQAFWVQGYGPAEVLWAAFGIKARAGFNFHNTYISNMVEIGLVGVLIQMAILYGALLNCLLWAFRRPSPAAGFFCSFTAMIVASTYLEVPVFFQFSITSVLVVCALVYGIEERLAWKAHQVRRIAAPPLFPAMPATATLSPGQNPLLER